jgi:hypothetical protein
MAQLVAALGHCCRSHASGHGLNIFANSSQMQCEAVLPHWRAQFVALFINTAILAFVLDFSLRK